MGWFSRTKKEKEQKKEKKKVEPLFDCPVCGKRTFKKATEFLYGKDELVGDTSWRFLQTQDCQKYTGDETGFCQECGGIVHGWIFADPENAVNELMLKDFNLHFLRALQLMIDTEKSGGDPTKALHKTIEEMKDERKKRKIEFNEGYYILIMLLENKIIELRGEAMSTYNKLKASRSLLSGMSELAREALKKTHGTSSPHETLKQLLRKCNPEFF